MGSLRTKYKNFSAPGARPSRDDLLGLTTLTGGLGSFIGTDGLGRIPAKYYLEFRNGEEIVSTMVFPYDPSNIIYNRPNPIRVNYTLGGVVREVNTIRRHDITLVGRSGLAQRSGYTRNGGIIYAEGEALFQEMDEFFKRYIEISTQEYGISQNLVPISPVEGQAAQRLAVGGNHNKVPKMILRCLDEDLHLVVEPVSFQWQKDTNSNRHDYIWSCQFQGYDYIEVKRGPFDTFIDATNNQINAIGGAVSVAGNVVNNISNDFVSPVRGAIRNIGSIFNSVSDVLNSVGSLTQNVYGIGSDLAQVTRDFSIIGDSWDNMFDAIGDTSTLEEFYPFQLLGAIGGNITGQIDSKAKLDASISALRIASEPAVGESDKRDSEIGKIITIQNRINSLGENLRGSIPKEIYDNRITNPDTLTSGVIRGEFLLNEENLGLIASNFPHRALNDRGRRQNVLVHTIAKDEDLVSLAIKYFGDAERWVEIQRENDTRDHRRNSDGNYFEIGEKIYIPNSFLPNANPYGEEDDPIGVDLLTQLGDIIFDGGDIRTVGGSENIRQAITTALLTRIGEVPGFEFFGLAQNQAVGNVTYGAAVLRNMLIGDPRIVDVTDIVIEIEDDTLIISCNVKTIEGETIPIRAEA